MKILLIFYLFIYSIKSDLNVQNPTFEGKRCRGKHQIAIFKPHNEIVPKYFEPAMEFKNFDAMPQSIRIKDIGITFEMTFSYENDSDIPRISQGPLAGMGDYKLQYLYLHWLEFNATTSKEASFPAELHMIFYSSNDSANYIAAEKNYGLTALSFGFKVTESPESKELHILSHYMDRVFGSLEGLQMNEEDLFPLQRLMSRDLQNFHTYYGTHFAPPFCTVVVIWIDFSQALEISMEQVMEFKNFNTPFVYHPYTNPRGVVYKSSNTCTNDAQSVSRKTLGLLYPLLSYILMMFLNQYKVEIYNLLAV